MDRVVFGSVPLSAGQRRRVEENLGLVAVHLRRNVPNLRSPRRDREWEDLFQEGCLGLIRAAASYVQDCGIPFAAYALPRIHNAVTRALERRFSAVYVPPARASRTVDAGSDIVRSRRANERPFRPKALPLSDQRRAMTPSAGRAEPGSERETIGDRLRRKYERAVRAACDVVGRQSSPRGDRGALVTLLLRERFLIPYDEARRPLRQIARDTSSSYARVAQCDKQISAMARTALDADPEFRALRRMAKASPEGVCEPIDVRVEDELVAAVADAFARRLKQGGVAERGNMLATLFAAPCSELGHLIRRRLKRLAPDERERLLGQCFVEDDRIEAGRRRGRVKA